MRTVLPNVTITDGTGPLTVIRPFRTPTSAPTTMMKAMINAVPLTDDVASRDDWRFGGAIHPIGQRDCDYRRERHQGSDREVDLADQHYHRHTQSQHAQVSTR